MKAFKVCYVSSEVVPFASTSQANGLAYTAKSLTTALKDMDQDVRLMMPKYKSINERKYVLREVIRLREVEIKLGEDSKTANGKTAFLPNSKVHVYFLAMPEYFDRKGFYSDPQNDKDYPDNAERFAIFCRGVLETLKLLYWQPDVIHCSDWATALIPYYLKTLYKDDDFFKHTSTVLTVHNFANQGQFSAGEAAKLDIPKAPAGGGKSTAKNAPALNLLKIGLEYADVISTTSQFRLDQILTDPDETHGLNDVIQSRKKDLHGILNGTHYNVWDPETDKHLFANYDAKSLSQKEENKARFFEELDLENDPAMPLLAVFPPLGEAEGEFAPVLDALKEALKRSVRIFLMGNKDAKLNPKLKKLAKAHPGKIHFFERYDKRFLHLVIASADMVLMDADSADGYPHQINGMRYGAVPVVRNIDGLADSVKPFDPKTAKGNGFIYESHDQADILKALEAALDTCSDKKTWSKLQRSNMRVDFSWEKTARQYLELYEAAAQK